ncbi:MAG: class I SAM-dependent methyltransferase [Candidatus Paceibacterota bacterium]
MNFEFDALKEAKNYQRALICAFAPHLRGKVMEIGAGIGQMARHLSKLPGISRLECVEPDAAFCREFRKALPDVPLVEGTIKDVSSRDWEGIVSINVLEHIEDDRGELKAYHDLLVNRNGKLCLFVPARMEIYAPIDKDFGHFRRYEKDGLMEKLKDAGFEIEDIHYYDIVGYLGWWFNFCLLKRRGFDALSVRTFDRLIFPWTNALESHICWPPIGKNLMVIARAR